MQKNKELSNKSFNTQITYIKNEPVYIYKIDNFFDENFYNDIKKYFPKPTKDAGIDNDKFDINDNFGKRSINANQLIYESQNQEKVLSELDKIIFSKEFFNFFVKKTYFINIFNQGNFLRKAKYLRYPITDNGNSSFFDLFFSKISIGYNYSFIKNEGGIVPHVDSQRKYLSLMLYFPDEFEKEVEYGTTFWKSKIPNFLNNHIKNAEELKNFKKESSILYRTPFVSNCLYVFLRNDFSWHTVEPLNVSKEYIRKSININFFYNN